MRNIRNIFYSVLYFHRAYERQKKKEKRQAMKESGEPLPPGRKRLKRNSMKNSSCHVKVAIDCSFDDLMNEKVGFSFFVFS